MPPFFSPAAVAARLLDGLLAREDWARQRLSGHSGKTARFVVGHLTLGLTVHADGYLRAADPATVPDVVLTIPSEKLGQLPGMMRSGDPQRIITLMHIDGDAALAHVVSDLARELRWDVEDELAGIIGDVAARRVLRSMKSMVRGARTSVGNLAGNAGEFISEERELVLGRASYDEWVARLQTSIQRLDALERRIAHAGMGGSIRHAAPDARSGA